VERPTGYEEIDVEARIAPDGSGVFFAAPENPVDPDPDTVTLVGWSGEPGLAIPREEWDTWEAMD
jgi:hypothetical protein